MLDSFSWPGGCAAAVSLTYDDALPVHRETVAPALSALGLRGTFYVPIGGNLLSQVDQWRAVAESGHELGNHTIFHPCRKNSAMGWLDDAFDLKKYSMVRMEKELEVSNSVLRLIDGREQRTFAATCGHTTVGEGETEQSIAPLLEKFFPGSRTSVADAPLDPRDLNFTDLRCARADDMTFDHLKTQIEETIKSGGWTIFLAHDVGTTGRLSIDAAEHRKLIEFLAANQERVWTAPAIEVTQYIRSQLASPWPA